MTSLTSLLELSKKIDAFRLTREAEQKVQHSRFNVFTTVLAAHDEVRLHTRFLHMLLNPTGHHDCDRLFLDLFLDTLGESAPVDHVGDAIDLTELVKTLKQDKFFYGNNEESRSPYGQFDLYFEFEHHIILIENKIRAGEGYEQLERYAKFLAEQKLEKTPLLLYLTPEGKIGETANGREYCRISYREHIFQWLEKCLQATYSFVNINQGLQQYKQVVEKLTGQNQYGVQEMEEIKDHLRHHPDIIKNMNVIQQARDALYFETLNQFFDELRTDLAANGIVSRERAGMIKEGFAHDGWGGLPGRGTPTLIWLVL
jgi:hypothetical protein